MIICAYTSYTYTYTHLDTGTHDIHTLYTHTRRDSVMCMGGALDHRLDLPVSIFIHTNIYACVSTHVHMYTYIHVTIHNSIHIIYTFTCLIETLRGPALARTHAIRASAMPGHIGSAARFPPLSLPLALPLPLARTHRFFPSRFRARPPRTCTANRRV